MSFVVIIIIHSKIAYHVTLEQMDTFKDLDHSHYTVLVDLNFYVCQITCNNQDIISVLIRGDNVGICRLLCRSVHFVYFSAEWIFKAQKLPLAKYFVDIFCRIREKYRPFYRISSVKTGIISKAIQFYIVPSTWKYMNRSRIQFNTFFNISIHKLDSISSEEDDQFDSPLPPGSIYYLFIICKTTACHIVRLHLRLNGKNKSNYFIMVISMVTLILYKWNFNYSSTRMKLRDFNLTSLS